MVTLIKNIDVYQPEHIGVRDILLDVYKRQSLSCADLMSQYNGTLNGQLKGFGSSNSNSSLAAYGLRIPAGEDIRKSIIATLEDEMCIRDSSLSKQR